MPLPYKVAKKDLAWLAVWGFTCLTMFIRDQKKWDIIKTNTDYYGESLEVAIAEFNARTARTYTLALVSFFLILANPIRRYYAEPRQAQPVLQVQETERWQGMIEKIKQHALGKERLSTEKIAFLKDHILPKLEEGRLKRKLANLQSLSEPEFETLFRSFRQTMQQDEEARKSLLNIYENLILHRQERRGVNAQVFGGARPHSSERAEPRFG